MAETRGCPKPNVMNIKENVCTICGGTGLVPSKVLGKFSGELIENCYTNCECRKEEPEYYREVRPEDFDFPMSYDCYRSLCHQHGWPDPGDDRPPEPPELEPQVVEHIHRHSDMSRKEFAQLQSLIGEVKYLREMVAERQKRKQQPTRQPKQLGINIG